MFVLYTTKPSYMTAGSVIPNSYDGLYYSSAPGNDVSKTSGVSLVAQYIESYKFKTDGSYKTASSCLNAVHAKALELDDADESQGKIECASENYPSLNNVMQAFIDLGYVTNASGLGFVKPSKNDMKYFVRQYGGIILETKITDQTYNQYDYTIDEAGTQTNEGFSKGFIAFGYDEDYLYVQNGLGLNCGSLGFHRMKWDVAASVAVKGAVFRLDNPS